MITLDIILLYFCNEILFLLESSSINIDTFYLININQISTSTLKSFSLIMICFSFLKENLGRYLFKKLSIYRVSLWLVHTFYSLLPVVNRNTFSFFIFSDSSSIRRCIRFKLSYWAMPLLTTEDNWIIHKYLQNLRNE